MTTPTKIDATTIRTTAALTGLQLTTEQAEAQTAVLNELFAVDAAIAALNLSILPAVGNPWGEWTDATDQR